MSTPIAAPASCPFEMDNATRAARAYEALSGFAAANHLDEPDWTADPRAVTDLSADLISAVLHHAAQRGADPAQVAAYGQANYERDVAEEGQSIPTGFPPVVRHPLTMLREIFAVLDGPEEWEAETIEHVAAVFTDYGFTIREPWEHPENSDSHEVGVGW